MLSRLPVRTVGVAHLSKACVLSQQSHLSYSNPYRNQAADQQPKNYMSDGQEEKEGIERDMKTKAVVKTKKIKVAMHTRDLDAMKCLCCRS